MTKRVLVTGASGFVGQAILPILLDRGFQVCGLDLAQTGPDRAGLEWVKADLMDPASFASLPRDWDYVIHLAGATIPSQFVCPTRPILLNVGITLNLLEHLTRGRVLLVSSCHVYAPSRELREETSTVAPQGAYGLSKAFVEQVAPLYRPKLDIRIARPFNHLGPGSPPSLVVPSLLRKLREAPGEPDRPLHMAGRDTYRDFIDVRDVAEAYLAILALEAPARPVFNVCTGRAVRISDVLRLAMGLLGQERPVVFAGSPNSADDNDFIVGSTAWIRSSTGWESRFDLASSLATMIHELP